MISDFGRYTAIGKLHPAKVKMKRFIIISRLLSLEISYPAHFVGDFVILTTSELSRPWGHYSRLWGLVMYRRHCTVHVILENTSALNSSVYSLVHPCYLGLVVVFNERLYGYGFSLFLNLETNDIEASAKHWISLINTHRNWWLLT